MRSRSSRMIRWAPFCPMPGTVVSVLTSSLLTARRSASGRWTASMAWASLGPTPLAVWTSSNICFSSSSAKPNRVSESSRTTMLLGRVASDPMRRPASVSGVQCSSRPDTPDLEYGGGEADGRDLATDEGDHRRTPRCLGGLLGSHCRLDAAVRATPPDVADGQRERVRRVSGLRRLHEAQQAGHHGAHLGLVGPATPRHRGLDLARRVQRDRQPATRRDQQRDAARLGGAHHRLDVVLAEHALDSRPRPDGWRRATPRGRPRPGTAVPRSASRRPSARRRRRRATTACRRSPRPHPHRTG